jgi:serine/threonine protein kinase
VLHKESERFFAMKVLLKSELQKRNQVEHTNTEKHILSQYTHPFLVKLYFSFQTTDKLYMCLEYVNGGELFYYLKKFTFIFKFRSKKFPESLVAFYAAEILLALEFLHQHDIIYRDLKPENILVSSDGHLKLTDFGLSKQGINSIGYNDESEFGNEEKTTYTFCGTPDYLAPEIIQGKPHGKAVDWWGFGILIYEMITGKPRNPTLLTI